MPLPSRARLRRLPEPLFRRLRAAVPLIGTLPPHVQSAIAGGGSSLAFDARGVNPVDAYEWIVQQGDYPDKIRIALGRPAVADTKALIGYNVGRPRKPGSSSVFKWNEDRSNFASLYAGDVLAIPPSWVAPTQPTQPSQPVPIPVPQPQPAPQPYPGPFPPGMPYPGGSMPPTPNPTPTPAPSPEASQAVVQQSQAMLAAWNAKTKAGQPPNFGTLYSDLSGTLDWRTRTCLSSFQVWANATRGAALRTDGTLDAPTYQALLVVTAEIANAPGGGSTPPPRAPKKKPSNATLATGAALLGAVALAAL